MKAVVTGGAGFIGSNICAALAREGATVTALDDLSSGHAMNLDGMSGVTLIQGDVRDPDAVARAMTGCEVVFHLAASVGNKRSIDHPDQDTSINVNGTLTVLDAARAAGVRKLVAASSAGIYGELKTIPISEDHPLEPLTPYGVSKLYTEKMALAFAHVYGLEAICLRYFNVYGPNQRFDAYGNVIPIFAFRALRGEPITIFGNGQQTRDFVHVDDVVQANLKAARNTGVSGGFNIASASQIRILDLANAVNAHLDQPVPIQHAGERAGDVAHSLADISAARTAFGFDPKVEMQPGLAQYMDWAKQEVARQDSYQPDPAAK
jgi:UDP-glucose 4-epimerase